VRERVESYFFIATLTCVIASTAELEFTSGCECEAIQRNKARCDTVAQGLSVLDCFAHHTLCLFWFNCVLAMTQLLWFQGHLVHRCNFFAKSAGNQVGCLYEPFNQNLRSKSTTTLHFSLLTCASSRLLVKTTKNNPQLTRNFYSSVVIKFLLFCCG
jgi:hypothetical protein